MMMARSRGARGERRKARGERGDRRQESGKRTRLLGAGTLPRGRSTSLLSPFSSLLSPFCRSASRLSPLASRQFMRLTTAIAAAILLAPTLTQAQSAPRHDGIPTPASVLGFEPGADRKLPSWHQVTSYFAALDR